MRHLCYVLACLLLYISCDDGDIIITSFEFDEATLQLCRGAKENEFVFYKINSATEEAISYNFFSDTYVENAETPEPIVIDLADTEAPNQLIYRQFNTAITNGYFCNNIPDATITVTEELMSIAGTATIENTIVDEDDKDGVDLLLEGPNEIDPQDDPDLDGIPNYLDDAMADSSIGDENMSIEAGYDTDADGIPDFKDQDDDNDNILTSIELPNGDPNDDSFLDTDEDGIPNYKDDDDDGDGILTRNEDINGDGNPRNDDTDGDGIFNYLDDDDDGDGIPTIDDPDTVSTVQEPSAKNTVSTTYRTTLIITELLFSENSDDFTEDRFSFGFRDLVRDISN